MAGGADDDDTILKAFDAFEVNGKIDADMFKHSLMTFGDKFTSAEVDNAFGEFSIEDGMIDAVQLKGLMVSKKEKKPNKRLSPNLSYQRHHLIRISSCHKTTSKKKTKKTNSPQKNSSHQSPVAACIQFFWKVVLLPSRI